jgi:hypothetical protein
MTDKGHRLSAVPSLPTAVATSVASANHVQPLRHRDCRLIFDLNPFV